MHVFFPVSRPSTLLLPFKTHGRVDYPDLSLHQRAGLARKEYEKSKEQAENGLLLQQIESTVNVVSGKEGYSVPNPFHTERFANSSLSRTRLLTARGVTGRNWLWRKPSTTQVQTMRPSYNVVATTLRSSNKGEENECWRYVPLTSIQTCAAVNPHFIVNRPKSSRTTLRWMFRRRLASSTRLRPSSKSPRYLQSLYDIHARKAIRSIA